MFDGVSLRAAFRESNGRRKSSRWKASGVNMFRYSIWIHHEGRSRPVRRPSSICDLCELCQKHGLLLVCASPLGSREARNGGLPDWS